MTSLLTSSSFSCHCHSYSQYLHVLLLLLPSLRLYTTTTTTTVTNTVSAFVPPKPGSDLEAAYEPVHLYRRRLNITYEYHPTSIHPEMCRFLSEVECQDADQSMKSHQERHRNLQKQLHQERTRRILRQDSEQQEDNANTNTQSNLRGRGSSQQLEQQDELQVEEYDLQYHMAEFRRILGEASQYYSKEWQQPTTQEELEELEELLKWDEAQKKAGNFNLAGGFNLNQTASQNHRQLPNPRVGTFRVLILLMKFTDHANRAVPAKYNYQILWNLRIRKWLIQNSYGNYDAFFDVRDWKVSDNTENFYADGKSGRVASFQNSFWPLLNELDGDPDWDWAPYDIDGDGKLDNMIVLHSGYAAEEGGQDCTNGREYLDRIWSHAFSDSNGWVNADQKYQVEGYMIASALDVTCDSVVAKMGVMTHEYLHTFYLIDLYDYSFQGKGIGSFDIMAYPYGFQNDGYIPVSLSAWGKQAIDWVTWDVKSSGGTYTLEPIVSSKTGCIRIPLQDCAEGKAEYLLVENRQQMGFDIDFWTSGVVIYHIDECAYEQYNRGYPGQSGWPGNGNHYSVAVMPKDGSYDLEQGVNLGDKNDLFVVGDKVGPNNDGKTFPNTDMYSGGNIQKSGVNIEILELSGSNFKVKVTTGARGGQNGAYPVPANNNNNNIVSAEAVEQFRTPDAEQFRMSGRLPQLPWFEERPEKPFGSTNEKYVDLKEEAPPAGNQGEGTIEAPPDSLPVVEEEEGAHVFESTVNLSSAGAPSSRIRNLGCWWVVGIATFLTGLVVV